MFELLKKITYWMFSVHDYPFFETAPFPNIPKCMLSCSCSYYCHFYVTNSTNHHYHLQARTEAFLWVIFRFVTTMCSINIKCRIPDNFWGCNSRSAAGDDSEQSIIPKTFQCMIVLTYSKWVKHCMILSYPQVDAHNVSTSLAYMCRSSRMDTFFFYIFHNVHF